MKRNIKHDLERRTEELARARAALDATTDGILVTDGAGAVTEHNLRFEWMWDLPRATLATRDEAAVFEAMSRCFEEPEAFKAKLLALDADVREETFDVLELTDGRTIELFTRKDGASAGRVWSYRDISERRLSEEALRDESRILELLNTTGMTLASKLDLQELVQAITDAATALIGASFGAFFQREEPAQGRAFSIWALAGTSLEDLASFDRAHVMERLSPELACGRAIRCDDIAGDPRFATASAPPTIRSCLVMPVATGADDRIGALLFGHPAAGAFNARTERIVAGLAGQAAVAIEHARLYEAAQAVASKRKDLLEHERAARGEAERMSRMKDEFLASLSHELRTPLSAILGWTHILRRGGRSAEDIEKGITTIERNARMQARLIDDLLDMNRIASGKMRLDIQSVLPSSFVDSAVETMRPAAEAKGIRLEKILDPAAEPIAGDPGRLQQIVWNLLSNAIKFTPKGGRVQVMLQRAASHIEISVADTGIGIRPEFLGHVFDRFRQGDASSTRSFGGLGLGLAIAKQLAEMHGGTISARSPGEGGGATFVVTIPLTAVLHAERKPPRVHPRMPTTPTKELPRLDLAGLRILVVDDESDGRELVTRVLDDCGAEVFAAASADEALLMLERARPDLVVSDIGMPHTDGFEFLKRIRASGKVGLPAIALTAFARAEDRTRALHAGFTAHLAKPVEPAELIATVASVSGRTPPRSL